MRFMPFLCICIALAACSREVHTASQIDAATKATTVSAGEATAQVETHAQATDKIEDHGQERIDENVVTTQSGGAIDLDVTTTKPDGTKIERHYRKGPVEVKRDATKTAAVQKSLTDDASSMFDAKEVDASKTKTTGTAATTTKGTTKTDGESKPDILGLGFGFLGHWWIVLVAGLAGALLWPRRAKILELVKSLLRKIPVVGIFL